MIYKSIDKSIIDVLNSVRDIFSKNEFNLLSISKKGEHENYKNKIQIFVIHIEKNGKPFKISLVSNYSSTVVSVIFPKKMFSKEEIEHIKNLINSL